MPNNLQKPPAVTTRVHRLVLNHYGADGYIATVRTYRAVAGATYRVALSRLARGIRRQRGQQEPA